MAVTTHLGTSSFAFGSIGAARPDRETLLRGRFRMAILGDFSGRAARGEMETGDDLARRRATRLDVDSVEDVIAGFATTLVLPIGKKRQGIEVRLRGLDDLHPDELYDNVEMFQGLVALRRRLGTGATQASAASELKDWGRAFGKKVHPPARTSRGNKVPANRKLSEFQKLIGGKAQAAEASPADDLIARVVGPHVKALPDPSIPAMQAAVDAALSDAMRLILHHPEFQSVEAQWRMLDLLARSIETDDDFDIVLYDISAEEIAADLAGVEDLTETGLYRLLGEGTPDGRGNFSALIGLYTFEETPPHAELLGRIARLAAHMDAPFFAAMSPAFMEVPKEHRHPLVVEAWDSLRAMPEAGHVALATPRFLLRRPYGKKSDPIGAFAFEEFTESEGLAGMLWGNPAVFVAILLAQSFRRNGKHMKLGSVMQLGEMPYHFVNDQYGDQVQLPCTERNVTQARAVKVIDRGFMPVLTIKGRDEIRLAAFVSLAGKIVLGPWTSLPPPAASAASVAILTVGGGGGGGDGGGGDDDELADDEDSEGSGDADLDGLSDAGEDDDAGDTDSDLDDLLAGFDDTTADDEDATAEDDDDTTAGDDAAADDDEEMDPELAALLASL